MGLFKIRSKTLHATEVRFTGQLLAKSSGSPFFNIGQITAAFQSPGTTAVARKLLNKSVKGSARKVAKHISHLGCRWSGPGLFEVSRVESSLWTRQGVDTGWPTGGIDSAEIGCPASVRKTAS